MNNSAKIPVFPLGTVVFPGQTLPLKIFESRYFKMIGDCERSGQREFAIGLISSGYEVGDNATPYRVATKVRYTNYMESDDLIFVSPVGYERVYLEKFDRDSKPYLTAETSPFLDDQDTPPVDPAEVIALEKKLSQMWISGGSVHSKEAYSKLLVKKNELSPENYSLYLAGCVELPQIHRQHLLESRSLAYRIRNLSHLLTGKLKTEG